MWRDISPDDQVDIPVDGYHIAQLPSRVPPAGVAGTRAALVRRLEHRPVRDHAGPNEYTGNLKNWNRVPDLPKFKAPVLIVNGEHDELTPACALRLTTAMPQSGTDHYAQFQPHALL